jgi:hypothetical protein
VPETRESDGTDKTDISSTDDGERAGFARHVAEGTSRTEARCRLPPCV